MTPPSSWLLRWLPLLPRGARALDLACGGGRHAGVLARQGLQVLGVDRDDAALAQCPPGVQTLHADLEDGPWPLAGQRFDVVLVTNYLWRPRWTELLDSVGDWYLHETFSLGQAERGRPRNPDFLLRPGELFEVCRAAGLTVLAYEDRLVNGACVQRVAARRRADAQPLPGCGAPAP